MGKHSLRHRTVRSGLGVPRPARRPGMSGSQALGHPRITRRCGRAENGVEANRLYLAQGQRKVRHSSWSHREKVVGLMGAGFSLAWSWLGAKRGLLWRLDGRSIGKDLLHGFPQQILVKIGNPWF